MRPLIICLSIPVIATWAGFVGLLLDFLGASVFALMEISVFRRLLGPNNLQLGLERLTRDGSIERGQSGFADVLTVLDKNSDRLRNPPDEVTEIFLNQQDSVFSPEVRIRYQTDGEHTITRTEYLKPWIDAEIWSYIRRYYYRIGGALLIIGFFLQMISYWIRNFHLA